jgi:hypothetical protein
MEKKNLSYFETKYRGIEGHGIYKQRLHPVCWLYEQCAQRASTNPTDLDDPFDNKKKWILFSAFSSFFCIFNRWNINIQQEKYHKTNSNIVLKYLNY